MKTSIEISAFRMTAPWCFLLAGYHSPVTRGEALDGTRVVEQP